MRYKIAVLFLFFYSITFAQKIYQVAIDTAVIDFEDNYWGQMQYLYARMPRLEDSKYKYHFRYEEFSQILDIYSNDGINFKGQYLNNLMELNTDAEVRKKNFHDTYFYSYKEVDPAAASKMGQWIIKEKIFAIPSEEDIDGWVWNIIGGDGFMNIYKVNDTITTTRYTCPRCQNDTIQGADVLTKFHSDVKSVLSTKKQFRDFNIRFKGGRYYSAYMFSWYAPTRKAKRTWIKNKTAREWLAQYEDEIDTRLKKQTETNNLILPPEGEYTLYFSKKGKLKKVKPGNMIYDPETVIDTQIAKQIEIMFKNTDLSDMHLKYDFIKTLRINWNGYYSIERQRGYWEWCI